MDEQRFVISDDGVDSGRGQDRIIRRGVQVSGPITKIAYNFLT